MLDGLIKEAYYQGAAQAAVDFGVKESGFWNWLTRAAPNAGNAAESAAGHIAHAEQVGRNAEKAVANANRRMEARAMHRDIENTFNPPKPAPAPAPASFAEQLRNGVRKHPLATAGALGAAGLGAGAIAGRETAPKPYLF